MTDYIDISVPVSSTTPVWEGDPPLEIQSLAAISSGDMANVSFLKMGAHTGTHIDAPVHFVAGRRGIDHVSLDTLIGDVRVVDLTVVSGEITAADLEAAGIPVGTRRILCKTANSRLWQEYPAQFYRDFVGIAESGARWIVEHGIGLVGVDYLGVERYDSVAAGAPTHHLLLDAEVVIVEGLNLAGVAPGPYTLICLPIRFKDLDGSPCRAILTKEG